MGSAPSQQEQKLVDLWFPGAVPRGGVYRSCIKPDGMLSVGLAQDADNSVLGWKGAYSAQRFMWEPPTEHIPPDAVSAVVHAPVVVVKEEGAMSELCEDSGPGPASPDMLPPERSYLDRMEDMLKEAADRLEMIRQTAQKAEEEAAKIAAIKIETQKCLVALKQSIDNFLK